MDDVAILIALSFSMFAGSFFTGYLPLVVPFSESRLRFVTVLGAGLLVGTALAVIIPEGVQSIYSAAESSSVNHVLPSRPNLAQPLPAQPIHSRDQTQHNQSGLPSGGSNGKQMQKRNVGDPSWNEGKQRDLVDQSAQDSPVVLGNSRKKRDEDPKQQSQPGATGDAAAGEKDVDFPDHHDDQQQTISHGHGHSHKADVHGTVGLALVAGFVMMLLVDQLAQQRSGRDVDLGSGGSVQPRYKITATIGLVVHAAADGVALGAASSSSHSEIQLIVFLAIMLHKAPASFGLVTFLLHEGLDKTRIRRHLLIFALAAPIAAIVTYILISQSGNRETLSSMNTTGILLLFSAGTFLYVATVHVLPEVAAGGHHHSGSGGMQHKSGFRLNELVALVFGALAPTFLTLGHSH